MTTKRTYHQHASTALHEAGHAVAALTLGGKVKLVTIDPDPSAPSATR